MDITIDNDRVPKYGTRDPFAEFKLILKRDGDKIVLTTPTPHCYRNWRQFTKGEKAAYNAILSHVVETAPGALKDAEVKNADNH